MVLSRRTLVLAAGMLPAVRTAKVFAFDNCKEDTRTMPFQKSLESGTAYYSAFVEHWDLGDCELDYGLLDLKYGAGSWYGSVRTRHTRRKDIWNMRVEIFLDATGKDVAIDQVFHGPEMSELDKPAFHNWRFFFPISGEINYDQAWVRLTSCC